jgi:adenylosuccinate lyase
MDIEDNADALRLRESLELISARLKELIAGLAEQIERWADTPAMAFTHLQPAEPTTIGYRLAQYGQDLLFDLLELRRLRRQIRGKGLKGAVGTGASYVQLLGRVGARRLERSVMDKLGLRAYPVATQIYPRKQDWAVLNTLAGLAGTLYRFAFDLRVLQSPAVGEWSEPFGAQQVGSSAMPFKRNPVNAENIDSLARYVAVLPRVLWDDAAHSLLERTLDDSANRRALLPEAFLIADEMLITARRILRGLQIDRGAVQRNLQAYAPFVCSERILMALARAGADRQEMHERLRSHAMQAWQVVKAGQPNPLIESVKADETIRAVLSAEEIDRLAEVESYLGLAKVRALGLARAIREELAPE